MQLNVLSVTFWFNIYTNHNIALEKFQSELSQEYNNFNIFNYTDNYLNPIVTAFNNNEKTNMTFSQINLQYNMEDIQPSSFPKFKARVLKLYEILNSLDITVLHTALFINGEFTSEHALKDISNKTISKSLVSDDLVDISIKLGKKHEDIFYKIISIINKKQVKLPQLKDDNNNFIPIPLISWHDSVIENDIIDFSYEINDKCLFDFTKDYKTTEFYLNKMLYLLQNDYESDIKNVLNKGKF